MKHRLSGFVKYLSFLFVYVLILTSCVPQKKI
jgi:hypothetical protein